MAQLLRDIVLQDVFECGMKITSAQFIKGIRGTNEILEDPRLQVAFIGRSNVGKSSLINYLVDRNSLVKSSSRPGKTREINFFNINDSIYFVDLPGYGYAKAGAGEREKLRKLILWYIADADVENRIFVLVIDARRGFTDFDLEVQSLLEVTGQKYVVVANKADKLNQKERSALTRQLQQEGQTVVFASAVKKRGKDDIVASLGL